MLTGFGSGQIRNPERETKRETERKKEEIEKKMKEETHLEFDCWPRLCAREAPRRSREG